ncbi:MAG: hypothetical protein RIB59_12130 [Rhodospirillales bacterium]
MRAVVSWAFAAVLSYGLLAGCMTPQEAEAYYREQCLFDGNSFDELPPGSDAFEFCMELERSGLGQSNNPDAGGYVRFYFFDD